MDKMIINMIVKAPFTKKPTNCVITFNSINMLNDRDVILKMAAININVIFKMVAKIRHALQFVTINMYFYNNK